MALEALRRQGLLEQGPALLAIANRTVAKAEALAAQVRARGPVRSGAYADFAGERFDLSSSTPPRPA